MQNCITRTDMPTIDINCDMGESFGNWTMGNDEAVMPYITSANIAGGFHAGDPHVMRETVELAAEHDVGIGIHPGSQTRWALAAELSTQLPKKFVITSSINSVH